MSYNSGSTQNPVISMTGFNNALVGSSLPCQVESVVSLTGVATSFTPSLSQSRGIFLVGPPVGTTLNITLPSCTGYKGVSYDFRTTTSTGAWNIFTSNKNLMQGPIKLGPSGASGVGLTGIGSVPLRSNPGDRIYMVTDGSVWYLDALSSKTGAFTRNP